MHQDNRKLSILVIEDNPGDYVLIQEYLKNFFPAYEAVNVQTFGQANSRLIDPESTWDIILLDLSLPDKQGEDLIRQILFISGDTPVIALTGYSDLSFSIKSLSLGVSDYLLKDDLSALVLYKSIVYSLERMAFARQFKESERRYRNLFQLNPQPMWLMDSITHEILDVNQSAITVYGYTSDEFLGLKLSDLFFEEDAGKIPDKFAARDKSVVEHKIGEVRNRTKSGGTIVVDMLGHLLEQDGKLLELVIASDITEKKKAREQLLAATIQAEDNERRRIAQEIHDGLQQTLVTAMLNIEPAIEEVTLLSSPVRERFTKGFTYLNQGINETRNIAHQLMPKAIEDFGFIGAMHNLLDSVHSTTRFHFHENIGDIRLPGLIEVALFRVAQEAITNILKYAQAEEVFIQSTMHNGTVQLTIEDNGIGFDATHIREGNSHLGLNFMRSRIGSLGGIIDISSQPGKGTIIMVEIPLTNSL
jgi:PAS domain S-box-containing protein